MILLREVSDAIPQKKGAKMEEEFLLNSLSFTVKVHDHQDRIQLEIIVDNLISRYKLVKTKENYAIKRRDYKYIYDYHQNAICTIESDIDDKLIDINAPKVIKSAQTLDAKYFNKTNKVTVKFEEQDVVYYDEIGTHLFSVKITASNYYTFHFYNLNFYQEMELLSFDGNMPSDIPLVENVYKKIYPNPLVDDSKSHVYIDLLKALEGNNFYKKASYLSMSRKLQFKDPENYNQYRLIQFFTKKDDKFYRTYQFQYNSDVLTTVVQYYKYDIFDIPVFIKQLKKHLVGLEDNIKKYKHDIPDLSNEEQIEIKQQLDAIDLYSKESITKTISQVIQKFTGNSSLVIKRDKDDKFHNFYLFSKENPNKVFICNGYYDFYPVIDKNSNYFTLTHQTHTKYSKTYGNTVRNRDDMKFKVKDRLICTYKINQWTSTKKELLNKYSEVKEHKFCLSDDNEDINTVIDNFMNKHILIKVSDKEFLEKLDTYTLDGKVTTKAKLLRLIRNNEGVKEYSLSSADFSVI